MAEGERVAVVGRTGAGKTSLIATLLRLVNIESGSLFCGETFLVGVHS